MASNATHSSSSVDSSSAVSRREFLAAGAGTLALSLVETPASGQAPKLGGHHIPPDKNLDAAWVESLFAKGSPRTYQGEDLTAIGMPVGGLCAGQLYLRGDGTLADWNLFNFPHFTGYGETCYRTYTPPAPVDQGFAIRVKSADGHTQYRTLDKKGFPDVQLIGEYPIGRVTYPRKATEPWPLEVTLEAYSPFVPLNARESAYPATVLQFRVKNTGVAAVDVILGGWLQNVVCRRHAGKIPGVGHNAVVHNPGLTTLVLSAREGSAPRVQNPRPPEVFADFESGTYGQWTKTGTAFGDAPATGTLPNQQAVTGFGGKYLVNSFRGGDASTGTLTSPEFTIQRPYVQFRIGGGSHEGRTCMNLLVDGKIERTATGKNNEKLEWDFWEVSQFAGKKAVIQIVDQATEGWGHINIDDIRFADSPPEGVSVGHLADQADFGTLALSVLEANAPATTNDAGAFIEQGLTNGRTEAFLFPLGGNRRGAVATPFSLAPGASREVTFLLTWHFAGGEHGRQYGNWFSDATAVARELQAQLGRLTQLTRLFHDTYYDSTLPHWLLDRLLMPVSTLATDTVQWWKNGRFWAWEGVGCCNGTCTHVWNYAQGMARLFPELERSARIMQDLGVALDPKTGRVGFRGEDPSSPYAADGQCGTVLKCYREHLMSRDDHFLKTYWPQIKLVMGYAITRDGNADGILEDRQWNTYDLDFVGPNTFVGSLYLAALKAAAQMAGLVGDAAFATRCQKIAERGARWTAEHLWNGEYYIQKIPPGTDPKFQYGDGCLADQLFGENWANQVDLGPIYPRDQVRTALRSIYKYNWAPDIAAQNKAFPPQRWFARPGEAGLFICTWPKGGRMQEPVLYRDEVWTGGEYQLASHLLHERMIREGLSIIRGIHDRYDGRRHNPWNEVECGDHYARALASWGCLLELAGFSYDGPAGRIGFAPRWQEHDFAVFFTGAEGWGTLRQKRRDRLQTNRIEVKHGQLVVSEVKLDLPEGSQLASATVRQGGEPIPLVTHQDRATVKLQFQPAQVIPAGQALEVELKW